MRLAYPRPSRSVRSRRVRGPLGVLIASMVLLASAIGPVTAARPTTAASNWKAAAHRPVTKDHVASAKEAAKHAKGSPRTGPSKALPLKKVKIAITTFLSGPAADSFGVPASNAAIHLTMTPKRA